MEDAGAQVIDLIFGRWRSQILYTGVKWACSMPWQTAFRVPSVWL